MAILFAIRFTVAYRPGVKRRALFLARCLAALLILSLGACVAHSSARTLIYVANSEAHSISVLQWDETTSKARNLQTLELGGAVMPMAVASNQRWLYAALRSQPYQLVTLAINPHNGNLRMHSSLPLVDSMANIALDQQNRFLLAASYASNKITVQLLDAQGVPQQEMQVLFTGAHPHQITATADNQFVYVSLLGEDRLGLYNINNRAAGTPKTNTTKNNSEKNSTANYLQAAKLPAINLAAGSGPRHFVFSPQQQFLYLLNELNGSLQVLARDQTSGVLTLLETHRLLADETKPWAADIHLTPDGKFLYATERSSSRIFGFSVHPSSGKLTVCGNWATERQPRAFAISPDGKFLVAAGQLSASVSIYRIDPHTGVLSLTDQQPVGAGPAWVEIVVLPDAVESKQ